MDTDSFFKELSGESDRACALIAGSALSEELKSLILTKMTLFNKNEIDHLFYDQNATLSDFSSRTEIAYALGLLSKGEKTKLDIIRKIRNVFAHTIVQISFQHEDIAKECEKLANRTDYDGKKIGYKNVFINTSMNALVKILKRTNEFNQKCEGFDILNRLPRYGDDF